MQLLQKLTGSFLLDDHSAYQV